MTTASTSDPDLRSIWALLRDPHAAPEHIVGLTPALLTEIARLRGDLGQVAAAEEPFEVSPLDGGPPARCEVCCQPIAPGDPAAVFFDDDSQVYAHADRCPESTRWLVEWTNIRGAGASPGSAGPYPFEEAHLLGRRIRGLPHVTRVRLARVAAPLGGACEVLRSRPGRSDGRGGCVYELRACGRGAVATATRADGETVRACGSCANRLEDDGSRVVRDEEVQRG